MRKYSMLIPNKGKVIAAGNYSLVPTHDQDPTLWRHFENIYDLKPQTLKLSHLRIRSSMIYLTCLWSKS